VKRVAVLLAAYGALAAPDFSPDGEYLVYSVTATNAQADTR